MTVVNSTVGSSKALVPLICTSQNNEHANFYSDRYQIIAGLFGKGFSGWNFTWMIPKNYSTDLYETYRGYLVAYKESNY